MKTYYCVTSSFDDRGRATANITDMIKAEEKPESTYTSTRRKAGKYIYKYQEKRYI